MLFIFWFHWRFYLFWRVLVNWGKYPWSSKTSATGDARLNPYLPPFYSLSPFTKNCKIIKIDFQKFCLQTFICQMWMCSSGDNCVLMPLSFFLSFFRSYLLSFFPFLSSLSLLFFLLCIFLFFYSFFFFNESFVTSSMSVCLCVSFFLSFFLIPSYLKFGLSILYFYSVAYFFVFINLPP